MAPPAVVRRLAQVAGRVWAGLRSRRFRHAVLVVGTVGVLAVAYEAAFRARLDPPLQRLPTALYTRPMSWRATDQSVDPLPIGPLRTDLGEYRIPVRRGEVPDHLIQAVLAVEDQRFYLHGGLDLKRIAGAAVANLKSGAIRQGGSTITQQLAKNLFLSARRTPLRKLREAAFALALEDRYDKATILEAYLNEIYLGQDGGDAIRGVGAAARFYFGKEVGDLTRADAALLAGMIRAPNRSTPLRHPEAARTRRDLVLGLMQEQGRITSNAAARARRERIRTRPFSRMAVEAPYFRDFALARLGAEARRLGERGAAVFTTLDAGLQRAANRAVRDGLSRLRAPGTQAALVALDPRTGDILAMVGGRDYGASQFNRAAEARRQPGSAFKPIVALAALGRPMPDEAPLFTLASVVRDEPLRVRTGAGIWEPVNYDGGFRGSVSFREALEQSLNVPFARIGLAVGPERIVTTARTLGITSPLRAVPSLALGASEVTLLELVRAFGPLAAGGYLADARVITAIVHRDGATLAPQAAAGRQVVHPAEAYLVTSALEGVITRGTGRGLADLGAWGGLAGKSGTSNDWRDAWFVAYTSTLVVGAWVGYDDGRSLGVPGARAALPLVARFLRDALAAEPPEPFLTPEGIEVGWTGAGEFGWAGWDCGEQEVFLEGTAPGNDCRSLRWVEPWARATLDDGAEELLELLREYGDDFVRRLAQRLMERSRRGSR